MKAVVAAFNQEKALVGAFSVIVHLHRLIDLRHYRRRVFAPVHVWDAGHAEGPVERGAGGCVEDAGDAAGLVILPVHREQSLVTAVSQGGQGIVTCRVLVY